MNHKRPRRTTYSKVVKSFIDVLVPLDKKQILLRISRKIYHELAIAQDNKIQQFIPSDAQYRLIIEDSKNHKRTFHIVGNSHAHSFTGSKLGQFGRGEKTNLLWDSYSLGPLSSLDLINRKWKVLLKIIDNAKFEKGDKILIPFGEAECRWYALKEVDPLSVKNLSDEELQGLITPYLNAAFEVFQRISELGFIVCTWSGHISRALPPREDSLIPVYGTFDVRVKLHEIWREEVRRHSLKHNYQFLDFLDNQLEFDNYGAIFLADDVHLDPHILAGFVLGSIDF